MHFHIFLSKCSFFIRLRPVFVKKWLKMREKTQINYSCDGLTWRSGTSVLCVGGDNTLPRVYSRMYFIFLLLYFGTDIQLIVTNWFDRYWWHQFGAGLWRQKLLITDTQVITNTMSNSYFFLPRWCTEKVIVVSQKLNEKFYRLNKKVNRDLFT